MKIFYLLFVKNPLIFFIDCLFKLNTAKIPVTIICVHTCVFVLHLWYSTKVLPKSVSFVNLRVSPKSVSFVTFRVSPKTLLTFCTNGVLLRTLMNGSHSLSTVTHIIVVRPPTQL